MNKRVPTLDFRRFDGDRPKLVAELGKAYREFGFCGISHHGIPPALISAAYTEFEWFFGLPEVEKLRYSGSRGGARGFTRFKVETAKGAAHADLKEFWHVGRDLRPDSPYASMMQANVWPEGAASFRSTSKALYAALDELGRKVLSALAISLGLRADWFDAKVQSGNSILRAIHYPPVLDDSATGAHIRAGAHEDVNLITLLVGASDSGLEILGRDGDWIPITTVGDTIVVNIGDMMQRLTNHVLPSTTHRVVNPTGEARRRPRYSMPFFLHPNPDFPIKVLPGCVTPDNPCRYPNPITSHDFLWQRLNEIKLT